MGDMSSDGRDFRRIGAGALWPFLAPVALCLSLSGCLGGFGGGEAPKAQGVNPITQGEIEVTALAAPPSEGKEASVSPLAGAPAVAGVPEAAEPAAAPASPNADAGREGSAPPPAAAAPIPEAAKSAAQRDCERRKGQWSNASKGLKACVFTTKDAAKRCTASTQCESQCLARSQSCAPLKPLFGCNEILDDSGRRMTQCIE